MSGKINPARLVKWYKKPGDVICYDDDLCDIEVTLGEGAEGFDVIGDGIVFTLQCEDTGVMGPCVKSVEDGCGENGQVETGVVICEIWQNEREKGISDVNVEEGEKKDAEDREEERMFWEKAKKEREEEK